MNEDHMNIVLIRPNEGKKGFVMVNPPIGLGYLSSYLKQFGHNVIILDQALSHWSNDTLLQKINEIHPQLIGLTALTPYYVYMKILCRKIKHATPNIPIVIGGVHVSALPKESMTESGADFAVVGEGEITLKELVDCLNSGEGFDKINGLLFKKGNEIIENPPRALITDLDSIPFPDWEQIDVRKYPRDYHGFFYKRYPVAPLFTTRGCPYGCTYCASSNFWKRQIRFRSAKNIVDEIEFMVRKFGVKEFHIWDDNFTLKPRKVMEFCVEIKKRNLDLTFSLPNGVRIDTLNEKILRIMQSAGFYILVLAIESGSQKILDNVNKKLNVEIVPKIAEMAYRLGFYLNAFFILGLPGETLQTIQQTRALIKRLPLHYVNVFVAQPLPGSELFNLWRKDKDLTNFNWNSIDFFSSEGVTIYFDKKSMNYFQKRFLYMILLNVKFLFRAIAIRLRLLHFYQVKLYFKRIRFFLTQM